MKQDPRDPEVYDLGEVEPAKPKPKLTAVRHHSPPEHAGVKPGLAGSLSMFVPGLGQMVTGEIAWGVFFLSWMTCCAACLWAVMSSLDRLGPTLRLFELPPEALGIAVATLVLLTITLHLSAVLHAQARAADWDARFAAHPLVAGLASLLLPGWGQVLAGHRHRATIFLGGLWIVGATWILVTPAGMRLLPHLGLALPSGMRDGWGPVVLLSAPVVLWTIAVYDAAAGAAAERRA